MKARAQLRVIEGGRQLSNEAAFCEPQKLRITIRRSARRSYRRFAAPLAITMMASCMAAPWLSLAGRF
jgi:hypothetical protein